MTHTNLATEQAAASASKAATAEAVKVGASKKDKDKSKGVGVTPAMAEAVLSGPHVPNSQYDCSLSPGTNANVIETPAPSLDPSPPPEVPDIHFIGCLRLPASHAF